VKLLNLNITFI